MQAVLFDVGGVLLSQQKLKEGAFTAFGVTDREGFWRIFNEESLPACRGEENLAACWRRIGARLGTELPAEVASSLWIDDFRTGIRVNQDVFEIVRRLAGRYKLGIVSNTIAEHAAIHKEDGLYELFDPVVLSHEVGMSKDNPAIFDLALARLGTAPEATVFIDDVEIFAETARSRRIHPIVFHDARTLRNELDRLGFDVN